MINIVSLRRTCPAYPSQWEGVADDGHTVLIHYQRTKLSVSYLFPGDAQRRFRIEDLFVKGLTEGDFVDGEMYDDGFAEFPTIRSVLEKAGIIALPENLDIPDDF